MRKALERTVSILSENGCVITKVKSMPPSQDVRSCGRDIKTTIIIGTQVVLSGEPKKPLRGFPPGKIRLKETPGDAIRAFVRPRKGGVMEFCIKEHEGFWWPAFQVGKRTPINQGAVSA